MDFGFRRGFEILILSFNHFLKISMLADFVRYVCEFYNHIKLIVYEVK